MATRTKMTATETALKSFVAVLDAMTDGDRRSLAAVTALIIQCGFTVVVTSKVLVRCTPTSDAKFDWMEQLIIKQLDASGHDGDSDPTQYVLALLDTCTDTSKPWRVHHCEALGIPMNADGTVPRSCLTHNGTGDAAPLKQLLLPLAAVNGTGRPIPMPRCTTGGGTAKNGSATPTAGVVKVARRPRTQHPSTIING